MSASVEKLLDAWLAPPDAGDPEACLATTFTFEPDFFEEDCLARFLGLDTTQLGVQAEVDSQIYVVEREERLANARACVLVERANVSPSPSHRWDVIPSKSPYGGVQHAKVAVLIWEEALRLIVSSANLTGAGYRSNVEVFFTFDWPGDESTSHLFHQVAGFLDRMIDRCTSGSEEDSSPRGRAKSVVKLLRTRVPGGVRPRRAHGGPHLAFLDTLNKGGLIKRAMDQGWQGSRPKRATVVSPYFDQSGADGLNAIRSVLTKRGEVGCKVAVKAVEAGEGQVRVYAPASLGELDGRARPKLVVWPGLFEGVERELHAKIILLESGSWRLLVAGSANATAAGLATGGARNIEAVIVIGQRTNGEIGSQLGRWLPKLKNLPKGNLVFEPPPDETDLLGPQLPAGFVEALYHPAANEVVIDLSPDGLPEEWSISGPDGVWFTADDSEVLSGQLVRNIAGNEAPHYLDVKWVADDAELTSELVVGVSDVAALPDPPTLAELSLEDLLGLLAAGGRLHLALAALLRRGGATDDVGDLGAAEVDPHAKVETSGFILRRMRRTGLAIEGLKARLERPISNPDALQRRLKGPFGPLALARAVSAAAEEGKIGSKERAFILADLALVLVDTDWSPRGDQVSVSDCKREALEVARAIKPARRTKDRIIDSYVSRVFKEKVS